MAKAPDFGAQGPEFALSLHIWVISIYIIHIIVYLSFKYGSTDPCLQRLKLRQIKKIKELSLLAIKQIVVIHPPTHLSSSPLPRFCRNAQTIDLCHFLIVETLQYQSHSIDYINFDE